MVTLGLDLGTTTVSAVIVETSTGNVLATRTRKSGADLPSPVPGEKCQDPRILTELAAGLVNQLLEQYPQVSAIGITGQMHGIVYLDKEGNCVSPLYTWQDQRAASFCRELSERTGYRIAPGYGLATHYALMQSGSVDPRAEKLCTIMDYMAFLLCGKEKLLMHASNAASLGFFSLKSGTFDRTALQKAEIDPNLLPEVTRDTVIQGYYHGIPVAVAIGDNQASFLGSVPCPETTALINFGTGSQISRMVSSLPEDWEDDRLEIRPYLEDSFLICGSALCGGRAYALLEGFFRRFLARSGVQTDSCYSLLNTLAAEGLTLPDLPNMETTFCGTRWDPDKRGSLTDLNESNFTPEALCAATLLGMARELQQLLLGMPGEPVRILTASGNAVQENPALLQAIIRVFGIPAELSGRREEAAYGAARFANATGLPAPLFSENVTFP